MPTIYSLLKEKKEHKIIHVNTVEEYFELAMLLIKEDDYIYRGISLEEQKYPKILRNGDCYKNEFNYLKEFEKYYGLYARTPNFWEFIALAQHHGLMTRLIDFSSNIFVSTFFALHKKNKNHQYRIFVFNRNSFHDTAEWNKDTGYASEPDDKMADIIKTVFGTFSDQGADYLLNPNYSNRRMFVQQGLFIIPGILTKKHNDRIYNQAEIEVVISGRIRRYILDRLNNLGYDEYRLMVDLDSACAEINTLFE